MLNYQIYYKKSENINYVNGHKIFPLLYFEIFLLQNEILNKTNKHQNTNSFECEPI